MTLNEILLGGGGILIVLLTLFEIAPIKVNPWSALGRAIGRAINGELTTKVDKLADDVGNLREDVKNLENSTRALENKIDENDAIACRSRIIRFGDELYHRQDHTKEHFDQILADITKYQLYCDNHKEFKDTVAEMTIEQIKNTYRNIFLEGKFL